MKFFCIFAVLLCLSIVSAGINASAQPVPATPVLSGTVNVRDCGAVGDGTTLDTHAVQKAIDTCFSKGGGTVLFPKGGHYLIGTIYVKSNVILNIEATAEILGSRNLVDYGTDTGISPYYPEELDRCLIYAKGATNIAFTGAGSINGGFEDTGTAVPVPGTTGREAAQRPMLLRCDGCKNIRMDSLKLLGSCSWCLHFARCQNIRLLNLDVPNRRQDGVDFESCENALVSGCHFATGDDCIAILASHNQLCENIVITDCTMQSNCSAIRLGPLSRGDIKKVTATKCHFNNCGLGGIKIGMYEGGTISQCNFSNITMDNVTCPILVFLGSFYDVGAVGTREQHMPIGHVQGLTFSDIKATAVSNGSYPDNASMLFFQGYPGTDLEDITLKNVEISFPGGGTEQQAARRDITDMNQIDPNGGGYWTDHKETWGTMPASALYARHVHGFNLQNVQFDFRGPDPRATLCFNQSSVVNINDLLLNAPAGGTSAASILLLDSQNVTVRNSHGNPQATNFLAAEGADSKSILLFNNVFRSLGAPITATHDAAIGEIKGSMNRKL